MNKEKIIETLQVYLIPILIGLFVGVLIVGAQVVGTAGTIQYDLTYKVFKIYSSDSLNVGGSLTVGNILTVSSGGLNVTGGLTVATGNITLSAANATVDGIDLDNAVTTLSNGTGIAAFTNTGNSRTVNVSGSVPTSCSGTGISCSIANNILSISNTEDRYINKTGDGILGDLTLSGSDTNLTVEGNLYASGLKIKKGGESICKKLGYCSGNNCRICNSGLITWANGWFVARITDNMDNVKNPESPPASMGWQFCCWAEP